MGWDMHCKKRHTWSKPPSQNREAPTLCLLATEFFLLILMKGNPKHPVEPLSNPLMGFIVTLDNVFLSDLHYYFTFENFPSLLLWSNLDTPYRSQQLVRILRCSYYVFPAWRSIWEDCYTVWHASVSEGNTVYVFEHVCIYVGAMDNHGSPCLRSQIILRCPWLLDPLGFPKSPSISE